MVTSTTSTKFISNDNRPYLSGMLGNILAHYDKALFSLLAPIMAPLLFQEQSPVRALFLTYGLLTVGIMSRPAGALFFSWVGSRHGQPKALFYSLMGIAGATLTMGALPLFCSPGTLSPFFMLLIHIAQTFCAAGESVNGAIFVLERTKPAKHNWMSSLYDASSTAGWFLASILVALLGTFGDIAKQWPWLCALGGMPALYGLLLRRQLGKQPPPPSLPQDVKHEGSSLLKNYWRPLLALIAAKGFTHTVYTFTFVLMNGYLPLVSDLSQQAILWINVVFMGLDISLSPCFGYLSRYWGHRTQMLWAASLTAISAVPIFYLLQTNSLIPITMCRLWVIILGIAFSATYHAWAQTLAPKGIRGRLFSLAYAGSQVIGAPSAPISLLSYQLTGLSGAPAFYLALTAAAAAAAIYKAEPIKADDIS